MGSRRRDGKSHVKAEEQICRWRIKEPVDPVSLAVSQRGWGETGQFKADRLQKADDTPFEFLTYQLDGRIEAYHGYNG